MAGAKGGGSWKVAYADFVTAMMAFFLVMWIGAQDQKTRQSVANYFVDPSGVDKKPVQSGGVPPIPSYGSVPKAESTDMGRGRDVHTPPGEMSPATKLVSDWLHADEKRYREWKDKARACREAAAASAAVKDQGKAPDDVAAQDLSLRLSVMFTAGSPTKANDVYQDLVFYSLKGVNWMQVAEDLLNSR